MQLPDILEVQRAYEIEYCMFGRLSNASQNVGPPWTRTTYLRVNTRSRLCLRTAEAAETQWISQVRTFKARAMMVGVDDPGTRINEKRMYTPSKPGYRIAHLDNAIAFDRCARDQIPCAWCGELLALHVFDTVCPAAPRPELHLTPH